jgi:hypothetical protein
MSIDKRSQWHTSQANFFLESDAAMPPRRRR